MDLRRSDRITLVLAALVLAVGLGGLAISIGVLENLGGVGAAVRLFSGG